MAIVTLARALAAALGLAAAPLLVGGVGCSSPPAGALALSWQLADGRDCATAGAISLEVRTAVSLATTPLASFRCSEGLAPSTVRLDAAPGAGTLYLDARTGLGGDLYRGQLSLDAAPPGAGATRVVTLYAVAAQ